MRVYVLHFESVGPLHRAFDLLIQCDDVASCMVEPERMRLRFLAPPRYGDPLVERLYLRGGLTWCSRHETRGAGAEASPSPVRHAPPR